MMPMADRAARSRLGSMGMGNAGAPSEDEGKVPMTDANYRMADNPDEACLMCRYFVGGDRCELVAGRIDPEGVCDLFEPGVGPDSASPQGPPTTTP